jgi:hypothetical protein
VIIEFWDSLIFSQQGVIAAEQSLYEIVLGGNGSEHSECSMTTPQQG